MRPRLWALATAVLLLAPPTLVALALETAPRVEVGPPDARAASRTRNVAERLRDLVATEAAAGVWTADEEELNAVLASAQRVVPGVYGRARVADGAVALDVSAASLTGGFGAVSSVGPECSRVDCPCPRSS